jgi:hypothetical protein
MFRFTIKDLIFLTVFVAVAAAALRYGGDLWRLTLPACLLFSTMTIAVVMVADRGRRQPMASGFVACVVVYQAALFLPTAYTLPTMKVSLIIQPSLANSFQFPEIAHLLWSLLFGYLGARLAGWVHARRIAEEARALRSS